MQKTHLYGDGESGVIGCARLRQFLQAARKFFREKSGAERDVRRPPYRSSGMSKKGWAKSRVPSGSFPGAGAPLARTRRIDARAGRHARVRFAAHRVGRIGFDIQSAH